jgi:NAD-dependent oxidoreductase involved in siderophore biosynthesis
VALQISYTDPATKVAATTCYAKILYINIDAVANLVDIAVGLYVTAAAKAAGGTPLATMHFWPPINQVATVPIPVDIQTSLYTYLKTQATFTGALDV